MGTGSGSWSAAGATASFQTVTPTGGCGSLPTSVVVRFSGGSGNWATRYAGRSLTLAYNSGSQQWFATGTDALGNAYSFSLQCAGGAWKVSLTGNCTATAVTVTGTSGATPNLTGTLTGGACTGSVVATITRT